MPPDPHDDEIPIVRFTGREWRAIRTRATVQGYDPEEWCRRIVREAVDLPPESS